MEVIQTSYPRFYQNTVSSDLEKALDLWSEMFANDDTALVTLAVKTLLQTLEFPPTIADVKKEMKKLVGTATNETTGIDEWNMIRKAVKNSAYCAKEEFDKLPPIAKRFVGSPAQLHDWAISYDFNADVVRGQFMRQYDELKEREEYKQMLENKPKLREVIEGKRNEERKGIEA